MSRHGFHTLTLGCKLNRFDTAVIEAELTSRGFRPWPNVEGAAVVVINTCTVTARADAEARKLIRSVRRRNAGCRLLVTGCYAELDPAAVRTLPGVDGVFGNRDKHRLASVLDEAGVRSSDDAVAPALDRGCSAADDLPATLQFGDRSRAFLRVQEGCDLRCSYCVIPRVRGASRSEPPDLVETALRRLLRAGYREVVLTGVNTGDYGKDVSPTTDLESLLRRLLDGLGPNRIRLNSLEPLTVSDGIVSLMRDDPRLAPHLQVPLQSGSDAVLRAMRRNYRLATYLERLERLRGEVPHVGLGADVIVGFPGETDALFEETFRFIERSPLNYLHVFPWSPRPGTSASSLPGRVHGAAIQKRSARLRELARRLGHRFRKRFEGRILDGVVLGERRSDGKTRVLTGNYIEVGVERFGAEPARGEIVDVRIASAGPDGTDAVVEGRPEWVSVGPARLNERGTSPDR